MSIEAAYKRTLANGLTVLVDPVPHVQTAALGVWVSAGSRIETEPTLGISHLLEHMAFKGTRRRSARAIVEEIESAGGFLNAYTGREQTVYHARVLQNDVRLAIDILGDILTASTFDPDELVREKDVIVQEIGQCADNPEDLIFDLLQAAAFADQPLGRPILGTADSVYAIGREALIEHVGRHYTGPRMCVAVSGAVDAERVADDIEAALGQQPRGEAPTLEEGAFTARSDRQERELEQAHVALVFPAAGLDDEDYDTLQVLNEVYGGGMSSRLFQAVREDRGLCYSIYSFYSAYADIGTFGFYAGTSADDLGEIVPVSIGELEALANAAEEGEVARARAQVKSMVLMGLESLHSRCEWMARQFERKGRVLSADEVIARIDTVSAADVRRVAGALLASGPPALSALGPIGRLEDDATFRSRFG
ncbi:MAG: pitrilysin family protein [Pseudomonadota bacterium]